MGLDRIGSQIHVWTPSGSMRAYLSLAQKNAPVVFLFMDVWGFRDELFGIADEIARAGNTCIVPDFYYRQGIVLHEVKDERGRARTLADLPTEHQERIRASLRALKDEEVVADVGATIETLKQLALPVDRFGCVGYCMGGRHALRVAAAFPSLFHASASLHGSDLVTSRPDSAHLGIPHIRGAFYCGFAERDPYAAPPVLSALESAFTASPATYQFSLHVGIHHGYALPERDVHDATATRADWSAIRALFVQHLNAA